ncbi:glycosyltransferase family 2 protein [Geobacillus thermoleovorans]|uniref:Glycosyltransferase family 2 protein n=1 Tax=Geobacillus thermoleovorans TaxID=33941 RepID=A0A2Z3NA05_GEOTH|nr:glycosyltransferase family 2 protein [Geobacillus thermoleovorans]AWO74733.1 glycosyltransferase family 2 protein [Geobacillus thermoleovorans]MBW7642881.1 glycosyltransferase family 2 protein [Geobacillus thermoleovorans]
MAPLVGIVICNFNKKEYLIRCIESVLDSSYQNFSLYVVDNASTDGSAELVRELFGGKLTLIMNDENKGGTGGFNRGMREALRAGHRYILLLDNDVVIDKETIKHLIDVLEEDPSIGIVGSAIYKMDAPDQLQEVGAAIDWDEFKVVPFYQDVLQPKHLPYIVESDYVPACCALIRADAVRQIGLMDEKWFIHWDDIEWCYRFKQRGYRVVACSRAKVWYKTGAVLHTSTFPHYYLTRNKIRFFAKYAKQDNLMNLAKMIVDEWFKALYFGGLKGKRTVAQTIYMAYEDALNNVTGRAKEHRIFEMETVKVDLLEPVLRSTSKVIVIAESDANPTILMNYMARKGIEYVVRSVGDNGVGSQWMGAQDIRNDTVVLYFCKHVLDIPDNVSHVIVVDQFFNVMDLRKGRDAIRAVRNLRQQLFEGMAPLIYARLLHLRHVLSVQEEGNKDDAKIPIS